MTFTVEPMINLGTADNYTLEDNWTVVTRDGKKSAQFEHTIVVTDDGYEILTVSEKNYLKPPYNKK
jgi:methionyl aminopeptidase